MNNSALKFKDIDEYIKKAPKEVWGKLRQMRKTIKEVMPKAEEGIKYGMPTFMLGGKNVVHFAIFKNHIGFYPAPAAIAAYQKQLTKYKTSKGAIQFPLTQPLSLGLIKTITKYRTKEAKAKLKIG